MPAKKNKTAKVKPPKTAVFFSNRVKAIDIRGGTYVFEGGRLEVPTEIGELVRENYHCKNGNILPEDESLVVNGKLETMKDNQTLLSLLKDHKDGKIFRFNVQPSFTLAIAGKEVVFSNHYAVLTDDQAHRIRNHPFVNEGKLSEINVELE